MHWPSAILRISAGLALAAVAVVGGGPVAGSPAHQPGQVAIPPPLPTSRAVLLVHGVWSGAGVWEQGIAPALRTAGFHVEALDFRYEAETLSNETHIALQAQAVARRIRELRTRSGERWVHVVAHSMGGLAVRAYLKDPSLWPAEEGAPSASVLRLVTLGTPHWGTDGYLLDPVGALTLARALGYNYQPGGEHLAMDRHQQWSPALRDMFAEWQPSPQKLARRTLGYPTGFKLGQWEAGATGYESPIQPESYTLARQVQLAAGNPRHPNYVVLSRVLKAFPRRLKVKKHLAYYQAQADSLGSLYPDPSGVPGIEARRVSPFLQQLNEVPADGGAELFLVAGDRPLVAENVQGLDLLSPFNSDPAAGGLLNDGVVPTESALGLDPISGTFLYPEAPRLVFNVTHEELTRSAPVIQQVAAWLAPGALHSKNWIVASRRLVANR